MLRELRIRDLAIIEDLGVEFAPGLNVLSGETGAGKSIILGALGLILGGRGTAELVRAGCESAEVQARFDRDPAVEEALRGLDVALPEEDEGLLLRRIVTRAGRSRAYVGAAAVPVAALRTLGRVLVDYASQHEHQVLLDEATHLDILDRFGASLPARATVAAAHEVLRALLAERTRLAEMEREQRAREDYLRFQVEELTEADLQPGEQQALEDERLLLRHAEERSGKAAEAAQALAGAGDRLLRGVQRLEELCALDPSLRETLAGLDSALIAAQEGAREMEAYARGAQANPRRMEEVDDRFSLLRQLGRKHRCDCEELPALRDRMQGELDELVHLGERLGELEGELGGARATLREAAAILSEQRRVAAAVLSRTVEGELEPTGVWAGRGRQVVQQPR